MGDISNKSLAVLVNLAIIVILIGILSSHKGGVSITSAATTNRTSGTANVTIQSVTLITLINNTVDFGVGFVNSSSSGNNCTLISNGTAVTKPAGCQGFNQPAKSEYFQLENAGNVNVTVTVNGSYATARAFLCNALLSNQNCTLAVPAYLFSVGENETGSCTTGGLPVEFTRNLNTSAQTICSSLDFNASRNSLRIPLQLVIPRDAAQRTNIDNVTFEATS